MSVEGFEQGQVGVQELSAYHIVPHKQSHTQETAFMHDRLSKLQMLLAVQIGFCESIKPF